MSIKKDILWRVGVVYVFVVLMGLSIIGRIVWLQFAEHDKWSVNSAIAPVKEVPIEANRGDVYSSDGKLFAVSVPYYDIRMDMTVDSLTDEVFYNHLDPLSHSLSGLFGDKTWLEYKRNLLKARQNKSQYYLVKRAASYDQMLKAKNFPIFNRGRFKGGVRFIENSRRVRPNGYLAARTIGSTNLREGGNVVGLEGAYDAELKGREGMKLFKRLNGDIFVPLLDENELDPEDGMDILTTIDLNIQDVAERALYNQLSRLNAHHGTAVLMEVETGDIKAIANLERSSSGGFWESVNFAIGESTVPGSTFKTASLMVAMEDGLIDINDSVDIGKGITHYYGVKVEDSDRSETGKISVKRALEISSNVGITKIITDSYKGKENDFIQGLYDLGLNQKLGVEIRGEADPFIKSKDHSSWSGVSLPMMSMGYELTLTPLQILSFYNGIANDGKVMKPRFIKEINYHGSTVKRVQPEVLNSSLCSHSTLKKVRAMLNGVVEQGTADNLKNHYYTIAGKTGTAQIPDKETGYRVKSRVTYQASFVGYFPADNPKYTCIVVINSRSNDIYYGRIVAGPVFLEIANKVYSTKLEMHEPVNSRNNPVITEAPFSKSGYYKELNYALSKLNMTIEAKVGIGPWVKSHSVCDTVQLYSLTIVDNLAPNVVGMGLKDAVYLLESKGMKVKINGRGTVRSQSLSPGSLYTSGQTVNLQMSLRDS